MKADSLAASSHPSLRTPLHRSSPWGCTAAMARATLCSRKPPARQGGSGQTNVGLPESSSRASTCGATDRACVSDSSPVTWTTCTSSTPGRSARSRPSSAKGTWSTGCNVVVPAAACWAAMSSACVRAVSRDVRTGLPRMAVATSATHVSLITPGPLGMAETSPSTATPACAASRASATLAMQQAFTSGVFTRDYTP
jgi:hypothetical protein